jgi:hypothetical protein
VPAQTSVTAGTLCAMAFEIFVKIAGKSIDKIKKYSDNESALF